MRTAQVDLRENPGQWPPLPAEAMDHNLAPEVRSMGSCDEMVDVFGMGATWQKMGLCYHDKDLW